MENEYNINFTIHGPFKIKKDGNRIEKKDNKGFWEDAEKEDKEGEKLSKACGCYLFAVQASKGYTPWYIGQTSKNSFSKECFGPHQLNAYNGAIAKRKGTPVLFLIAERTKNKKFSRPSINHKEHLKFLETLLIGTAFKKNKKIKNISKTQFIRNMVVPGFWNSPGRGRSFSAQSEFKNALFKK